MDRIDEITQTCVQQILSSWDDWNREAEMTCTMEQDSRCWEPEMHAKLWHVVKAAVEEAAGRTVNRG